MDLTLSDEQRMLAASGRDFVLRSCPIARVRDIVQEPAGFDRELWDQMRALGWPELAVPEADGGSGAGMGGTGAGTPGAVTCPAYPRGP